MADTPSIRVDREPGVVVFNFTPSHHAFRDVDVQEIRKQLLKAVDQTDDLQFVVDFTGVEYMSSSVLGVLVSALLKIQKKGGQLRLTGVDKELKNLFHLTGLQRVFRFCDDRETAIKSFSSKAPVAE